MKILTHAKSRHCQSLYTNINKATTFSSNSEASVPEEVTPTMGNLLRAYTY